MTIQDALDYCIENPQGLSSEELLAKFPQYRDELASLLGLASSIASLVAPGVPAVRRVAMKARLIDAATAPAAETAAIVPIRGPQPITRPQRKALPWFLSPGWVVAAAALLLLAFIWWSSAGALPDSPFYGVKLASENITLNIAGSAADKSRSHTVLANSRLYDLRSMQQGNKLAQAQPAFDNYASHLDNADKIWTGLSGQERIDLARLLYASSVAGEVTFGDFGAGGAGLPSTLQDKIRATEAELTAINNETKQALVAASIDPASVLGSIDSSVAPLLTPVVPVVIAVPTFTVTEAAGSATPTIAVMATPTAAVPDTSTPARANPTATAAAATTSTRTPAVAGATDTPIVIRPTHTPGAASTPTHLPARTPTRTPRATATRTATGIVARPTSTVHLSPPTVTPRPIPPTGTPLPPTGTLAPAPPTAEWSPTFVPAPIEPTDTPEREPRLTPPPQRTATTEPPPPTVIVPSPTAEPPGEACDLRIRDVTITCAGAGKVDWSATVRNPGKNTFRLDYTATLQVMVRGGGGWEDSDSHDGTTSFAPGDTVVGGSLQYDQHENIQKLRVNFSVSVNDAECQIPDHHSQNINPCP